MLVYTLLCFYDVFSWGPLHGGQKLVIEMLEKIKGDGGDVDKYVSMLKINQILSD